MALFLQFRCHYSSKKRWQVKPSVHIPSGSLGLHILILCAHRQIVLAMTQLTEDDPYRYTEYLKSGSFSCLRRWPGSIAETEDDLIKRLNEWNDNMENRGMRATQTHTQPFYSSLDFVWVSRYQKNHSPSHTYRGHQLSHISFIHLIWSMASALFNLRDNDWVKKCMEYEVEAARSRGRPKKTWREIVEKDCQLRKLNTKHAMDRIRWMKQIRDDWWPR